MDRFEDAQLERIVDRAVESCRRLTEKEVKPLTIYEDAWNLVLKAREKANQLGIQVVISVLDSSGQVVMTYRMEDALLVSNEMAYKKAYTAVGMRMQSKDLAPLTQPGQWLYQLETMTDNKVVSLAGGIPIYYQEKLIGSIGVSGGTSEQDQAVAEYAVGL
ncbi:GlcG/HbpS family heme-binding protein [Streptococcus panodentis]|uniref:Propanediol utilization protein n=1 Tax=Streptococcus panodentis TaxID=1581472 RepID=A0ABS5AYH3_9STRE|nr:heme-binding protein [Streptococcus panodentis]MBP2621311.1 propanediol utilization protein [Streptococcus panodentis]